MTSIEPAVFDTDTMTFEDNFIDIIYSDSERMPSLPKSNTILKQDPNNPDIIIKRDIVALDSGDPDWTERMEKMEYAWRKKAGTQLANELFALNLEGDPASKKFYVLKRWPENYRFYVKRSTNNSTDDPRLDGYITGAGKTWSSPIEVKFHLAWLILGAEKGECHCQRCNPRVSQTELNTRVAKQMALIRENLEKARISGLPIDRRPNTFNSIPFLKRRKSV